MKLIKENFKIIVLVIVLVGIIVFIIGSWAMNLKKYDNGERKGKYLKLSGFGVFYEKSEGKIDSSEIVNGTMECSL